MLMKDDKKSGMIAAIVKRAKGENHTDNLADSNDETMSVPVNDAGDEVDSSIGVNAAAEELISAMNSNDPQGVVAAIKSMMEMLKDEQE